ncbi:hypothetical protein FHR32_005046 [Streptosporangium album]|uniref:Antitoxin n=1 Tax=Streptosporangium album TaxID=47479 RepID=A0A7W7RYM6_9ACTN|nr:antitoxin [Streptosporangium album]MBB4940669.1 hypothetical protein [Streptosporangium album]
MSIFDKVKSMLGEHSTKVEELANQGIDKAAQMAKEKTGGKYDQQIDSAADMARKQADTIDGQTDTYQEPDETTASQVPGETTPPEGTGETGTPPYPG